jgi:hypothetical protein
VGRERKTPGHPSYIEVVEGHAAGAFSTARITLQIHLKEFPRKVRMQVGAAIRRELNLGGAQ